MGDPQELAGWLIGKSKPKMDDKNRGTPMTKRKPPLVGKCGFPSHRGSPTDHPFEIGSQLLRPMDTYGKPQIVVEFGDFSTSLSVSYGCFRKWGCTRSHHPFLDGIFHEINHPAML